MESKQTKSSTQEFHGKREKVIRKLLEGKASASLLQSLLHGPPPPPPGEGPDTAELQRLARQIVRSFSETLSEMGSCHGLSAQIPAVDCGGSDFSGENCEKGPPAVKERRGSYKRRRTSDSWVQESSTPEDGCAWRKYGQKEITSSNYPRCYFRCTHKYDGCKAIKQVQMIKDNPITYQTTYFNRHTCNQQLNHQVTVGSYPTQPDLISFDSSNFQQTKQDNCSPISRVISQFKQSDQDLDSEANSILQHRWLDMSVGLEPLGFKPECDLGGLHGLDEVVDQLGDIDYAWCNFD